MPTDPTTVAAPDALRAGPRAVAGAILATGVAIALLGFWQNRFFFHDDAYISLRYVHNWLDTGQLVWNPGERVEGYTNFLHLILIAPLAASGLSLPGAARLVNLLAFAALAIGFWRFVNAESGRLGTGTRSTGALAVAGLVASYPLLAWVLGGLEAPLVAALVFAGHAATLRGLREGALRHAVTAGAVFGLATLARPDAVLFAGVATLSLALGAPGARDARLRRAAALGLAWAAFVAPHLLWRHLYYGDWLPNTFYAKATGLLGSRLDWGTRYLLIFLLTPPFWPAIAGVAGSAALRGPAAGEARVLLASCSLQTVYLVFAGGDHMPGWRLFVPLVPLLALLVFYAGPQLQRRPRRAPWAALLFLALLALQPLYPGGLKLDPAAAIGNLVGEHIRDHWRPGVTIALNTAGSTPFANPDKRFIDMLGLNDRVIARRPVDAPRIGYQLFPGHAKGDGAYVLSREPDYIIFGPAEGAPAGRPWFLSDLEIQERPAFVRCYRERRVELELSEERALRVDRRAGPLTFVYFERRCPRSAP
jgi:hypothetical protein